MLRSGPGQAVFAGQQLRQTIAAPDVFQNEVGFKTLGLFPGTAVQEGRWRALDGSRYVVRLSLPLESLQFCCSFTLRCMHASQLNILVLAHLPC